MKAVHEPHPQPDGRGEARPSSLISLSLHQRERLGAGAHARFHPRKDFADGIDKPLTSHKRSESLKEQKSLSEARVEFMHRLLFQQM